MNKDLAVLENMIVIARRRKGKKKGSARSRMLKMIMPLLSQENGLRLASAIDKKDTNKMRSAMDDIKQELANKLAVEASGAGDFSNIFEEIFADLFGDKEKNAKLFVEKNKVEASGRDVTQLVTGRSPIQSMTRELVANGYTEFTDANGDLYTLSIRKIDVIRPGRPQPTMRVVAELKMGNEDGNSMSAQGEYASACSELVISAMSLAESD